MDAFSDMVRARLRVLITLSGHTPATFATEVMGRHHSFLNRKLGDGVVEAERRKITLGDVDLLLEALGVGPSALGLGERGAPTLPTIDEEDGVVLAFVADCARRRVPASRVVACALQVSSQERVRHLTRTRILYEDQERNLVLSRLGRLLYKP